MEPIVPYLTFNGNAVEALAFYSSALNGIILYQQTFGESSMASADEMKDKIMHATFQADQLSFMVSDCPPGRAVTTGTNLSLALNFKEAVAIETTFKALGEGATITMDLQDTFWGAKFGMLTDKFGINWMFNHDITTGK